MMLLLSIIFFLFCVVSQTTAFCFIHAATPDLKKTLLTVNPSSLMLINNLIDKYSKQSGVSPSLIKSCIESKKKKSNLRGFSSSVFI